MIVDVERAARCLEAGEVVAYPTETVYGLGVDSGSRRGLERLSALKGRSAGRAYSVLVADMEDLERYVPELPNPVRELVGSFWPGPLTLVLPCAAPELEAVASSSGVGFRCSPHPSARALARRSARPVVSTSCNRSGAEPCRRPEEVEAAFGCELPVLEGDPSGEAQPSTVVAIDAQARPRLLREGSIAYSRILERLAA